MICKYCGEENGNENRFCQKCGKELLAEEVVETPAEAPVEEPAAEAVPEAAEAATVAADDESTAAATVSAVTATATAAVGEVAENAKNLFAKIPKKVVTIAGAALVLLIALIVVIGLLIPAPYTKNNTALMVVYSESEEKAVVVVNNKALSDKLEGELDQQGTSMDGAVALGTSEDDELYYITKKGAEKIAEDVSDCVISANGKVVAYVDADDALMLYDGKAKKVAEEIYGGVMLSMDGKVVLYQKENEDGEVALYAYNGKEVKLGEGLEPMGASNGGKYIYAVNEESDLYVLDMKGEKNKLSGDVSSGFVFNQDGTQVKFNADGESYISVKGDEKVKITTETAGLCVPAFTATYYTGAGTVYGVSDLRNKVWRTSEGDIYLVNKKGERSKLAGSASSAQLTEDGKTLFFLKDGDLRKVKVSASAESEKLAEEVVGFYITADGKYAYFVNEDDELRCCKGTKDLGKIADDVDSLRVTGKDVALFTSEGTLYSCDNGKSKDKVADDVESVVVSAGAAYYVSDGDTVDLYASNGNDNFKVIVKDIEV